MHYSHRQLAFKDFQVAERWMIERTGMLENNLGPIGVASFGTCMAVSNGRSLAAFVIMILLVAMGSRMGSPPPPILKPGSLKNLHPHDAELIRLARSTYQSFSYTVRRSPTFLISWLALGCIVVFG